MGSYSLQYARIWTPRGTPRAWKAGAFGWPGHLITLTSWKKDRQERKNEGKPVPPARGGRGRGGSGDGDERMWLDVDRWGRRQAAADRGHQAAGLCGGDRRGGVEPHRLG